MITINLLPIASFRILEKAKRAVAIYMIIVGAMVGAVIAANTMVFKPSLVSMNTEVSNNEGVLSSAESNLEELKKINADLVKKEKSVAEFAFLEYQRRVTYTFLKEINTLIPSKDAWLASCTLESNGDFMLTGYAADNNAFAGFLDKLENNKLFANIVFNRLADTNYETSTISGFGVTGNLTYNDFDSVLIKGFPELDLLSDKEFVKTVKNVDSALLGDYAGIYDEFIKPIIANKKAKNRM